MERDGKSGLCKTRRSAQSLLRARSGGAVTEVTVWLPTPHLNTRQAASAPPFNRRAKLTCQSQPARPRAPAAPLEDGQGQESTCRYQRTEKGSSLSFSAATDNEPRCTAVHLLTPGFDPRFDSQNLPEATQSLLTLSSCLVTVTCCTSSSPTNQTITCKL